MNTDTKLYLGDTFEILPTLQDNTVDMIFADPPYFLSNDGITCSSGKVASVNKGNWDKLNNIEEVHDFNRRWISQCKRILKDDGTIFISGTFHNIYSVGMVLLENSFVVLNNITWEKTNPPPNISCRYFTHSTETIIWAKKSKKSKHKFNYDIMKHKNGGKQMKDVWRGACITKREKEFGNHPTQKPIYLLENIILSSTNAGDLILDPFSGSGTTMLVASRLGRNSIGIEKERDYCKIAYKRLKKENMQCIVKSQSQIL
jgi:site-specific DNA-methyltransferase (adenine-specific)